MPMRSKTVEAIASKVVKSLIVNYLLEIIPKAIKDAVTRDNRS